VLARLGRHDQADACLRRAMALLRDVNDPVALGLAQCSVAENASLAGNPTLAFQAFGSARELLELSGAGPSSELARRIAGVERRLNSPCS
jgi:hypothetical protein